MPQFVRAGLKYNRWLETEGLQPVDFPADLLKELQTTGNQLSVFEVSAPVDAERIAIAFFAHGKKEPEHTAYAVFDRAEVEGLGIAITKAPSDTPDATVNTLHYDLYVGTIRNLIALAGVIARGDITSILKADVTRLLKDGFESGRLDPDKNRSLCARVNAQVPSRGDATTRREE